MSNSFNCGTCLLHRTSHCPHGLQPDCHFCTGYAPAGSVWDAMRPTLCSKCPQHSGGICGLSGMPVENTPSSECMRHKAIMQQVMERVHGNGASTAPADDMAAYPGMAEFMQGGMAAGLTDAPMADIATGQAQTTAPRQTGAQTHGGQQRNRRATQHQAGQQGQQHAGKQGQQGQQHAGKQGQQGQQHAGKQGQQGQQHTGKQGQQGQQHAGKQGQQPGSQSAAKKPSMHLYFLNLCSILGMLFIFLAFGFFFCVPQWKAVPWQTGVCTLGLMPCVSLVAGLVWGVMNPQCRPVQFALAACLGASAARMFWQSAPFSAVLTAIAAGFAIMVLCFYVMRLGVLITNAIFRVKKRMAKLLPAKGE